MRRLLLMSYLMLAGLILQAAPITKEQAKEAAAKFLNQKDGVSKSRSRVIRALELKVMEEKTGDAFFIFNVGSHEGFVIVSGDDRTYEILGYADKGEISSENMPDNMKAWLQSYAKQIKWMQDNNITVQNHASVRTRAAVKTSIAPLVQTTWDQGDPYYNNCPLFLTGNRSVTGCVATAMAQVVNYHGQISHKPEKTLAIAAYDCDTDWGSKVHVDAIEADQTFEWDKMLLSYTSQSEETAKAAVALLMQYCGASVHMDYADQYNGGSAAYSFDVAFALKKYFGYDADTRYVRRKDYTFADWNNMIYDELASSRPVVYGGQSSGGGHAFVIDGYDGDDFFHVNWGWGGQCDGNFRLSALDPDSNTGIGASSTTDGYNTGQDAIIGAQPSTGTPVEEDNSYLLGEITGVSGTTITARFANLNREVTDFDSGIGYLDSDGKIVLASQKVKINISVNRATTKSYTISDLADGSYQLFPISKVKTSGIWKTNADLNKDQVLAVVSGGNITLTWDSNTPNLAVSSMTFSGIKYMNSMQDVDVTLTNSGGEFAGFVYMFASTTTTKGTAVSQKSIMVSTNGSTIAHMGFLPTEAGTYNIWICTDQNGNNVIGQGNVTIEEASIVNTSDLQIVSCHFDNEDSSTLGVDGEAPNQITDVYSNNIVAHMTIMNMSSEEKTFYYAFVLSKHDGSGYPDVSFSNGTYYILTIPSKETYSFDKNLGTVEYGSKYKVALRELNVQTVNGTRKVTDVGLFDDHIRFSSVEHKCATPEISIDGGKVTLSCDTEGVTFKTTVTYSSSDMEGEELVLSDNITCHISVYAAKEGYGNSDTVTKDVKLRVGLAGDANADGEVDIADAVSIVNLIVGKVEALSRKRTEAATLEPQ